MENLSSEPLEPPQSQPESGTGDLSPTVRALGWVSLCTDISSEMVYPLTPGFLTRVLGAPAWAVGLIEGVAESTASLLKLFSGRLSDRSGRRKPLAVTGYGLAAVSKPLIAIAGAWPHVLGARFLDRVGKGLRAAPRDALIAESSAPGERGRAFGFHRSMDTTGAVLGPLLGWVFLHFFPNAIRSLYALAFVPAMLGVLVLVLVVREKPKPRVQVLEAALERQPEPRFTWSGLSLPYRRYLLIVGLFGLGNSSDAFLLLRAQGVGIRPEQTLLLYAAFNMVEACLGTVAGKMSDRVGRRPLLAAGYIVFALTYAGFALLDKLPHPIAAVWALFGLYGLYSTLTQGVQKALVSDLVHPARRGAETGAFHMLVGIAALPASLLAGWLYAHLSPSAPFAVGAATALLASVLLMFARPEELGLEASP